MHMPSVNKVSNYEDMPALHEEPAEQEKPTIGSYLSRPRGGHRRPLKLHQQVPGRGVGGESREVSHLGRRRGTEEASEDGVDREAAESVSRTSTSTAAGGTGSSRRVV